MAPPRTATRARWGTAPALALAALALALSGCGGGGGETSPRPQRTTAGDFPTGARRSESGLPNPAQPRFGWRRTDFSTHSVPLSDFISGGPGKNDIPALERPRFTSIRKAEDFLEDREPVAVVQLGGAAKAYPLAIMIWHEIVDDRLAGLPIAVTYCPLCNSTVAFDRRVGGRVLDFRTTGALRNDDLVMYDRQTQSWWQQLTGEAVVGKLTGERLRVLPSQILTWRAFKRLHSDGRVLSFDTGYDRPYGRNPYVAYDSPQTLPPNLGRSADQTLPPKERVAAVRTGPRSAVVYPFRHLQRETPVNDLIAGRPAAVFFDPTVTSALDTETTFTGRRVGAAAVFDRRVEGQTLSFESGPHPGTFRDRQTGSLWDMSGRATAGPLAGARLHQIPSDDQFWFALAAFFPRAEIRR